MLNLTYMKTTIALALVATLGCVGDTAVAPPPKAAPDAPATLSLTPLNAVMAVGGTVTITATGYTVTGSPVTDFDSLQYAFVSANDSTAIHIAQSGANTLVATGVAPTSQTVQIDINAYKNGARFADEVLLNVTSSVISGATLTLSPSTTTVKKGAYVYIPATLGNGVTQVSGLQLRHYVQPADDQKVVVYRPYISDPVTRAVIVAPTASLNYIVPGVGEGSAYVYADVDAYGTVLRDSVLFHFIYATSGNISVPGTVEGLTLAPAAAGQTLTFSPGASVRFSNSMYTPPLTMDFIFSDSTKVTPSTNIYNVGRFGSGSRTFSTPGTYTWTVIIHSDVPAYDGQTYSGTIQIK